MICEHPLLPLNKESRCWSCGRWYYHDRHHGPQRIFDRDGAAELVTAQQQTGIVRATRYLEQHGHRYLVDFGWQNAEALAGALGYRYAGGAGGVGGTTR